MYKNLFITTTFFLFNFLFLTAQTPQIGIETVFSGLSNPLEIKHAGDSRLFVVEQPGRIQILDPETGQLNATSFLDITSIVLSGGERGLLGLAFHPDYDNNGYFYVYYTNLSGDTQISRFSVSASDPDLADAGSELQMLSFVQPFGNHNGGHIAFGPDGMLYIGTGDGGSGGDPDNNSQTLTTHLGKMLRLDVDVPAPYIPADNPFVSDSTVLDEIWAYGLRNPWKFSFDPPTGQLWIADVGQGAWEEINREDYTEPGLNYGWRCYEGNHAYNTNGCPPASEMTFPLAEYARSSPFCSVTGGYVYRGAEFPNLQGLYFFADLCASQIGTVTQDGTLTFHGSFGPQYITSFGVDVDENLYMTAFNPPGVYKIVDNSDVATEQHQRTTLHLYPNPATDVIQLQISGAEIAEVTVFDLHGKVVNKQGNTPSLDISTLTPGLYLVKAEAITGEFMYAKFLKN